MERGFKRKNNTSFTGKKKFKEEKNLGRLDEDTFAYFSRIADVLKAGDIDEDEMAILASNTLKQTEGIELEVCNHILSAKVIEAIIPFAKWSQIHQIVDAIPKDKGKARGSCVCRVEEAIIREAGRKIRLDSEEKEDCLYYLTNISTNLLQNFDNQIWDININYSARTLLTVCSGYVEKGNSNDPVLDSVVTKFSDIMTAWPEISENYSNIIISGFLQILLFSLKAVSEISCKKFAKFLIRNCFVRNSSDEVQLLSAEQFENVSWSKLLEAIIDVSQPKLQKEIYQTLFSEHIETLVLSKMGLFSVCKLISSCGDKEMLENILERLKDKFTEILAINNLNVLHSISVACLNTGEKQAEFIKNLTTTLGCSGPNKEKYVISCILSMKSLNDVNTDDININFHGSLILQNCLKFKKPQKFVEALLSLNITILKKILTDAKGCYITDAFVESTFVGAKSKDRLLNLLKGHYSDLAMDKYGSRSFDILWNYANMKYRSQILSEMSRQIKRTQFGSIIASKTGLDMYLKDKHAWERSFNSSSNKTNTFVNIKSKKGKIK